MSAAEYPLSCYARLVAKHPASVHEWDSCGTEAGDPPPKTTLRLSQLGFLHVSCGSRQLESVNISSHLAGADIRAVFRDRHMLFLQRLSDVGDGGRFRRFRVKFQSGGEAADCVRQLVARNVSVKGGDGADLRVEAADCNGGFTAAANRQDVPMKELVSSLLHGGGDANQAGQLPSLNISSSELNAEVEEAVRSLLMDTQFHRFVASVQQLLQQMAASAPE